ncbi:MAG: Nramp family divalent metal transporter [bacterium]|nr:Nramp family divalent metal transporter [bacterium]
MPNNNDGKLKKFWKSLGPGLITGASDDDPSGVATYSIAGAKFGLAVLWTVIFTLPFMVVIQKMAGRIGLISGKGIAGNMKKHYPRYVLVIVALLAVSQNIINIGADISGMAAAFTSLVPISPILYSLILVGGMVAVLILVPYYKLASYLKWVAVIMFSYIVAAFFVEHDWTEVFKRTIIPEIHWNKDYLLILVAIFGTTISPYLFFWQASEQVEEERVHVDKLIPSTHPHHPKHRSEVIIGREIGVMNRDIISGMFFSNIIMYFIIIMATSTLFNNGFHDVETINEIASVLRPLAGDYANLLFLIGITAAGILAIPILAGSAAYVMAETFGWKDGLGQKFGHAKQFYTIISLATALGLLVPLTGFDPVKALFYTAILHGVTAPFLIYVIIHMANNPKVIGKFGNRRYSNVLGYILFGIMTLAAVSLLFL